jgi:hypothetical protein
MTPIPAVNKPPLAGIMATVFVALFGLLIASFPVRNADLWRHLADGRAVVGGDFGHAAQGWLSDVAGYLLLALGGEGPLVAAKATLVAVLAGLLVRVSRSTGPWWLATACAALAVLAISHRVLLQPATASYLFLGITLWLLWTEDPAHRPAWADWRLLVAFWVWANADGGFVIGLGVVAAYRVGELLDRRGHDLRRLVSFISLVGVCALTPNHVTAFRWPPEWSPPVDATGAEAVTSPFTGGYFQEFGNSPAAMAYFPLLAVSGLSFLGTLRGWRWSRFLPWLGLAILSAVQARTVSYFAVIAGPALAWNLQGYLARRPVRPLRPAGRAAFAGLLGVAGVGLLVAAWPGWLQGPPYEPRRWAFDLPDGVERAAKAVEGWRLDGTIPADTRVLHASADSAGGFAWFTPAADGLTDPEVVRLLVGDSAGKGADEGKAFVTLRARRVGLVVVAVSGGGRSDLMLARLLSDPTRWPLLHVGGGVAVFAWKDPQRKEDPYRGMAVDFDRLAFRPADDARPPAIPPLFEETQWWHPFVRPASRTADRDEAALLLLKAEAETRAGPDRRYLELVGRNAGELVGTGFGGGLGRPISLDLTVRTLLLDRPPPDTPDVSVGVLYAGVRAGRRAAVTEAEAQFLLGQFYLRFGHQSVEREWGDWLPRVRQMRQVQAVAALTRAVALNPSLPQPHLDLGLLYQELNCGDLSVTHLQRYRELIGRGKGAALDPRAADERVERLTKELDRVRKVFEDEASRGLAADRAAVADQLGLSQTALGLLLDSDPAALGTNGVRLEIGLLLRTGRGAEVLAADPKLKEPLGGDEYHWVRALAHLGGGDYAAADRELAEMLKDQTTLFGVIPEPYTPRQATVIAAQLVSEGMLAQRPGENTLEAMIWRISGERKFAEGLGALVEVVAHQNEVNALRGLVALEAGDIPEAKRHFEAVTAFTTDRTSPGMLRGAHLVSTTCLGWIRDAERK